MPEQAKTLLKGLHYLVSRFLLRKQYLTARAIHGITLKFKTEDAVGRYVYKHGIYEPEITRLIESVSFTYGDVFIDVGAHVGWYSILVDKLSPEGVRIFSFEPDPLNYELLKENIELNRADKVFPINTAIGERNGKATLYLYPDKNRGRHSLMPLHNHRTIEVGVLSLDSFIRERSITKIKLLKVDVEGYELAVLKGARESLYIVENIILEYSPDYMIKGGINPEEFKEFLKTAPFKIFMIDSKGLIELSAHQLPEKGLQLNLLLKAC